MSQRKTTPLGKDEASELAAYAKKKGVDFDLSIPDAYLPAVLENLKVLQAHAQIVIAALEPASLTAEVVTP